MYGCKDTGNACAAVMNTNVLNGARGHVDGNCIAVAGAGAKNAVANMTTTIVMTAPAIIAHRDKQKKEIADRGIVDRQPAGRMAQSIRTLWAFLCSGVGRYEFF